ncbi:MAG: prolipoprotein diacylglyceryl transferase [Lachnospiraceae bacterium]|nr:prolipoprotein diacylglyceryl transferase [Lachnospiraceae bacterium]
MSLWGNETSVRFPNLGIDLSNLPRGLAIGTFNIAFYGVIIACGMLVALGFVRWKAKKTGQNPDIYLDCALWAIPLSVIGTRVYEVAFNWEDYKGDFWKMINIRNGGLAIYGGIIAAILTVTVYCKVKKLRVSLFYDTAILGLILGQIIGRWGNFFNREAFGKYTDSLLAMQIEVSDSSLSSIYNPTLCSESTLRTMYEGKENILNNILEIRNNIVTLEDGRQFIQVHPTFLYESLWNLVVLGIMLFMWPRKKFNGEIILIYLAGYGFGRFFIESIRMDQLFIWGTGLAASQVLSGLLFIAAMTLIIVFSIKAKRTGECDNISMVLELKKTQDVEKTPQAKDAENKEETKTAEVTEPAEAQDNENDK